MKSALCLLFGVSLIKILLIPSYSSTDFEVHRNWLALTNSLPISKWYYENTSEWTLDYPPFFAYFEWMLSQLAYYIDPNMLKITNLNYKSLSTLYFQRFTVIFSDLVLFLGINKYLKTQVTFNELRSFSLLFISLFNAGLLLVDHIHFQYNGMLLGLLLLSVSYIRQGKDLKAGIIYAFLLMMKHIYLYVSLLYFVYLLRHYCWKNQHFSFKRLFLLGFSVSSIFLLAFLPFLLPTSSLTVFDNGNQILSRLFPIKRGLCHAYWAPNCWAFYSFSDKILSKFLLFNESSIPLVASMTGGLVGEFSFQVLPSISISWTILITFSSMLPILISIWKFPHPEIFLNGIINCMFSSFLFGYHVHEKAILQIVFPMALLALENEMNGKIYILMDIISCISLFPLLFTPLEEITKVLLFITISSFSYFLLNCSFYQIKGRNSKGITFKYYEKLYLILLCFIYLLGKLLTVTNHSIILRFPFLPLMLLSVVSSLGFIYLWILTLIQYHKKYYNLYYLLNK